MRKNRLILTLVIASSAIMALLNAIAYFVGVANRPQGTQFLGTIHYWEDYFFYLNHYYQGAHGAWLTANRFTPESTPPTIIYWSNVLMGKLFAALGVPSIPAYTASVVLLSFLSLFFTYVLLNRILKNPHVAFIGFLMTATATSLQNRVLSSDGEMIFWPFQIWKTPHFAFDRLGGVPHQILLTLLVILFLLTYLIHKEHTRVRTFLLLLVLSTAITTIQMAQGAITVLLLVAGETIVMFKKRHLDKNAVFTLGILGVYTLLIALYMYRLFDLPPHIQTKLWEAAQHSYTTIPFLIKSIGPVTIFALIGVVSYVKQLHIIHWYGLSMILLGYVMFLSRIPQAIGISNSRLLFPSTYVFWGLFGAMGADWIAGYISPKIHLKKRVALYALAAIYLIFTIPTLVWELNMKVDSVRDTTDITVYLPQPVASAYEWLSAADPDGIVLANPATRLDSMTPPLSGHTSYSGHMLQTMDNDMKKKQAAEVFSGMLRGQPLQDWLEKSRIRYILMTSLDGDIEEFYRANPFLIERYRNEQAAVFENVI